MQPIENLGIDWMGNTIQTYLPDFILCGVIVLIIFASLFKALNRTIPFIAAAGIFTSLFFAYGFGMTTLLGIVAIITILLLYKEQRMEVFLFIVTIFLGADLLMTSNNFIMVLLSIELISISSYVLTAGNTPDKKRAEAAWKFFIYGSVATAVMIFGMTYLYGYSATVSIPFENDLANGAHIVFIIGGFMMLCGLFFKMTAAPFHLWAPDVYEAAPAPIVAYLSVVPKLAAFGFSLNFINYYLRADKPIAIISLLSIVVGTLAALNQSNAKRMMAYSSVAQAGFLLIIPVAVSTQQVFGITMLYSTVLAIANYAIFIVIDKVNDSAYSEFSGIGYTNPLAAIAITFGLISLVGIPPVAGFMAKLFVFTALWQKISEPSSPIFLALFVVGLLATVASLFFYLKIPFYAFLRRVEEKQPIKIPLFTNLLLLILVGLLLTFFVAPGLFDGLGY